MDAIKTMPETIKQRTADNAQKQVTKAKDILFEAVNPTTRENKAVLNKRVEDLVPFLENNPMKNSLEDVKSRVDTQKDTAGKNMETYENDVGVK